MVVQSRVTVEEFDRIAGLPENAEKRLEFIGGEIVEVVTNSYVSIITARIIGEFVIYLKKNNLGYVTATDGGYMVFGDRYIPDVAFISKAKQPDMPHETWIAHAPDLAVEVISPTDEAQNIAEKVANYLAAGTLLWVIYPEKKEAKVFKPGKPVKTIPADGTLDGEEVLPGFKLALKDIFAE